MAIDFQFNLNPIKEPRGFIRLVQILFAILAFVSTWSFDTKSEIVITCNKDGVAVTLPYEVEYPFDRTYRLDTVTCFSGEKKTYTLDYKASSQFYVTTGCLAMFYAIAAAGLYTFLGHIYENNTMVPLIDLAGSAILTLFWFLGWCVWWANVGNVKDFARELHNTVKADLINSADVYDREKYRFAQLTISLLFGFGNIILWAASCWFVYKDTHLYKGNDPLSQGVQPPLAVPRQQVPTAY
ncbi:Synaptophysin-like protein 1 [Halotydeus destructor]|nr:Synaptophysin-like protein 1 [Halotydeus destructor]